ncbi:MAG: DUF882 domain-containing protein [Roseibium sp.]
MITRRRAITGLAIGSVSLTFSLHGVSKSAPPQVSNRTGDDSFLVLAKKIGEEADWIRFSASGSVIEGPREVFSDRITGKTSNIDPVLVNKIQRLQREFGSTHPIEVVSSYVDPERFAHNKYDLNKRDDYGVYMHTVGEAIDFRVIGVPNERVIDALNRDPALLRGGIGLYLNKNFVHLDSGPNANWSKG